MSPEQEPLQLRDIHLPAPPELWPPAPGWWIAGLLTLALLTAVALLAARVVARRAYRRRILAQLEALPAKYGDDAARLAAEVSMLLRRLALKRYPRTQVAGLSGPGWLEFLDRHAAGNRPRRRRPPPETREFRDGPGRVLDDAPYAPRPQVDQGALLSLARRWIRSNL
jgi:hypothetical protein